MRCPETSLGYGRVRAGELPSAGGFAGACGKVQAGCCGKNPHTPPRIALLDCKEAGAEREVYESSRCFRPSLS